MKNELIKLIIYSLLFGLVTTPIHLELNTSIWVWSASSTVIGFFAGILNDIYVQLIKLNRKL